MNMMKMPRSGSGSSGMSCAESEEVEEERPRPHRLRALATAAMSWLGDRRRRRGVQPLEKQFAQQSSEKLRRDLKSPPRETWGRAEQRHRSPRLTTISEKPKAEIAEAAILTVSSPTGEKHPFAAILPSDY
eukprot:CAMPEP_0181407822 /NCGR_PEP_ID=MMETSP1110-20121109/5977_1 /TAXON_ID=174948 /ORGANISM="Symbiodinium sp., Strain CCMP421" /LENGTH=130 /DNA_ID=CAMNT_0023530261 /DNA_START=9 /DNA_END=401 /DNA_ORIENTATION=+